MNVLFKSIPIGIRANELAEFIESKVTTKDLDGYRLHIIVASIEMLQLQDNFTHPIEQFGIIRISSEDVAKKIIQKLHGLNFNDYQITVREYFNRSDKNDPRKIMRATSEKMIEKRVKERREYSLKYSRLI